ncbi:MAG TPA: ABC transporter substrate-binding protein [Solirubrobacteraceae bacterium]
MLDDKSLYGRGLAATFVSDAKRSGVTVAGTRGISTDATQFGSLASSVASAADCMLFVGSPTKGVVALWGALHAASASRKLFGTDALASETFAALLGSSQSQTYLTGPTLDPSYYGDSGQAFYESYETRFGGPPDSSAIFGYEAMDAVLHAIDVASSKRRGRRRRVLRHRRPLEPARRLLDRRHGRHDAEPLRRLSRLRRRPAVRHRAAHDRRRDLTEIAIRWLPWAR